MIRFWWPWPKFSLRHTNRLQCLGVPHLISKISSKDKIWSGDIAFLWKQCFIFTWSLSVIGNESLFKWSWSCDQDGRHAHIWLKPFKTLRNQQAYDLRTWYKASRTKALQTWFKWWSRVDLDLVFIKVRFTPNAFVWENAWILDFIKPKSWNWKL